MRWTVLAVALLVAVAGGCTNQNSPAAARRLDETRWQTYQVPPKQMVQIVHQVLQAQGLATEQEQQGVIVTAYKEGYEGDWHIARRWQERTRFRIAVIPDWDEPLQRCRLEISEQTQARSNERAPWVSDPALSRPQRAEQILEQIRQQVSGR